MALKENLEDVGNHIKDAAKTASDVAGKSVKKVVDTAEELMHRGAAQEEHKNRELLGDRLPVGAKVDSVAREAGHDVKAEMAGVKRKLDGL